MTARTESDNLVLVKNCIVSRFMHMLFGLSEAPWRCPSGKILSNRNLGLILVERLRFVSLSMASIVLKLGLWLT